MSSGKNTNIETNRMPTYLVTKPKFQCPLSPYIMWHHGLSYTECPLVSEQRDMVACDRCTLKGDSKARTKSSKKHKPSRKKSPPKIEKRGKEPIPKIGKPYVSE